MMRWHQQHRAQQAVPQQQSVVVPAYIHHSKGGGGGSYKPQGGWHGRVPRNTAAACSCTPKCAVAMNRQQHQKSFAFDNNNAVGRTETEPRNERQKKQKKHPPITLSFPPAI